MVLFAICHVTHCLHIALSNYSYSHNLHQMAEYRISIYGRKKSEWDQMASWIVNNELYSENVVWLIQVMTLSVDVVVCF